MGQNINTQPLIPLRHAIVNKRVGIAVEKMVYGFPCGLRSRVTFPFCQKSGPLGGMFVCQNSFHLPLTLILFFFLGSQPEIMQRKFCTFGTTPSERLELAHMDGLSRTWPGLNDVGPLAGPLLHRTWADPSGQGLVCGKRGGTQKPNQIPTPNSSGSFLRALRRSAIFA